MWVLGINWRWHDTAASLVDGDGRIWALVEEERLTRVKHAWDSLPCQAVRACLASAGIDWTDVDVIALGWDLPRMGPWTCADRERLFGELSGLSACGTRGKPELLFVEHHLAHALSAFHASGFEDAGVLVIDGSGEREAMSIYAASRAQGLTLKRRWARCFSLGTMYEAATRTIGLGYLNEGKTMGLAPYGMENASELLPVGDVLAHDGAHAPHLPSDAHYNEYTEAWLRYFETRFPRVTKPPAAIHQDPVATHIAASAQRTVEGVLRALHTETVCSVGSRQVCVTGGVALNSVANGLLPEPIFVPPFAHDAGVAVGAAWHVCPPSERVLMQSPYLGTQLAAGRELGTLRSQGFDVRDLSFPRVTEMLLSGAIGAIAEGRAEVGPRALGHRSIIAIPAPAQAHDRVNYVKRREPWRPLAPVTLERYAQHLWSASGRRETYMVGTTLASTHARTVMPAAVHVDGTTRPQVLQPGEAIVLERLLEEVESAGHPPVLINTSFNGPGEPIVESAADAAECFRALRLDFLVLEDQLVQRGAAASS